ALEAEQAELARRLGDPGFLAAAQADPEAIRAAAARAAAVEAELGTRLAEWEELARCLEQASASRDGGIRPTR
ncbi:MAG TPA: hypothetical protein VIK92_07610, partial [Thermaerobacter sp.]